MGVRREEASVGAWNMRLESESRRANVLEQRYTHGNWTIVKIFIKGKLCEIIVNRREEQVGN